MYITMYKCHIKQEKIVIRRRLDLFYKKYGDAAVISQPVWKSLEATKGSNCTSPSIGPIIPKETTVVSTSLI